MRNAIFATLIANCTKMKAITEKLTSYSKSVTSNQPEPPDFDSVFDRIMIDLKVSINVKYDTLQITYGTKLEAYGKKRISDSESALPIQQS